MDKKSIINYSNKKFDYQIFLQGNNMLTLTKIDKNNKLNLTTNIMSIENLFKIL